MRMDAVFPEQNGMSAVMAGSTVEIILASHKIDFRF